MSHSFLFEYFVEGDEYACFFDVSELVVDGCPEDAHGGAKSHVSVDEWWDVVSEFAYLGVECVVVFFECWFVEEFFELAAWCVNEGWVDGCDELLFVAEVFVVCRKKTIDNFRNQPLPPHAERVGDVGF